MKNIRIACVLLFLVSILAFGGYKFYENSTKDTVAPVLSCKEPTLITSVSITEEELMEGVTAMDDVSGDVTDSLVIEKISAFTEDNTRIITYAAIDEKGNVGRLQRTITYTDYEEPKFSLSEALRVPMGKSMNLLKYVGAYSVLDGDLSDNVKYSLNSIIDLTATGTYDIVYRVTDSSGYVEYLPMKVEVYDGTKERIEVILKEYLIYLPLNGSFQPEEYFVGSAIEGELSIASDVDVTTEGVYYVDYQVTGHNSIGKSRLVVVVK